MPVQYAIVVGRKAKATHMLEQKVRELGEGVLVVMGSHGRTGLSRLLWGSKAEEAVRHLTCPVLVVKAAAREVPVTTSEIEKTVQV